MWYLPGLLYDGIFERPLAGLRRKVAEIVNEADLFPLIDICCGPGEQARRLARVKAPDGRPDRPEAPRPRLIPSREPAVFGLDINLRMIEYASARRPGVPFICGDATRLPLRQGAFRCALFSFALHEQEPETRRLMLDAARAVIEPGGNLIFVDFESPWDPKSRRAHIYTSLIEFLAGAQHFRRNRDFLRRGGLRALLAENGLTEVRRHDIAAGACAIVLAA
jgi:ubiquinone/menaquinone biosynthesis C-methylase UbiE